MHCVCYHCHFLCPLFRFFFGLLLSVFIVARHLSKKQDSGVICHTLNFTPNNKVSVHPFQRVADSKGGAFGRSPQRAKLSFAFAMRRMGELHEVQEGNPRRGFPFFVIDYIPTKRQEQVPTYNKNPPYKKGSVNLPTVGLSDFSPTTYKKYNIY